MDITRRREGRKRSGALKVSPLAGAFRNLVRAHLHEPKPPVTPPYGVSTNIGNETLIMTYVIMRNRVIR